MRTSKRLTLQQRREIFHTLVKLQDMELMTIPQSRQKVAKDYEISDEQLKEIEEEGVDKDWPPLNEAAQEVG
jgi:hypothetical protein